MKRIECRFQWYHCQAVKAIIPYSIGIWMMAKTYIAQQVLTLCYEVWKNGALPVIYELPHSISHSSCNLQSTQKRLAAHHFLLKEKPKQCNHLQKQNFAKKVKMLWQIQNKAKRYSKGVIHEENWMPVPMVPLPRRQSQNSIFNWHLNVGKNLHSPTGVDLMLWSLQKWCNASHLRTAAQHFSFIIQLAIHSEDTGSAPFFVKGKTKAVQSFTIAELCNKVQNDITDSRKRQMLLKGCYSCGELNAGSNGTTARPSKPKLDFLLAFEWGQKLT